MRLAQLARKLSVKSSDIIQFLSSQAIALEDAANTKVEDEHVRLVVSHFSPGLFDAPLEATPLTEEVVSEVQEVKMEESVVIEEHVEGPIEKLQQEEQPDLEEVQQELPDIIRAPKIELTGLKVLGKIDLPEKKKKEELTAEIQPTETVEGTEKKVPTVERPKRNDRKPKSQTRTAKNPLAQVREREQRQEEERRKQAIERRKEIRTQNYLKKVQVNVPVKRMKVEEPDTRATAVAIKQEQPKTLWGKFVKWLTTY